MIIVWTWNEGKGKIIWKKSNVVIINNFRFSRNKCFNYFGFDNVAYTLTY